MAVTSNWENVSVSVILHGASTLNSIKGFRLGYLAGRIEQLAVTRLAVAAPGSDLWDTMGATLNQYQRDLAKLEHQWDAHVSFELFPETYK